MCLSVRKGDILIAPLSLNDPNFERSVVLICDHSDKGTYGLILNRPIPVSEEVSSALPFRVKCLYQGGPVQIDALQVLHPFGNVIPGGIEVLPGIWLGGDFAVMSRKFGNGELAAGECRFFLGYSGWDAGQLEDEFKMSAWLVVSGTPDLVTNVETEEMWPRALREYGKQTPLYANFPSNPSWN